MKKGNLLKEIKEPATVNSAVVADKTMTVKEVASTSAGEKVKKNTTTSKADCKD